jgi:hypothetical protein
VCTTDLAPLIHEGDLDPVFGTFLGALDLRRDPALLFVWKPHPGPFGVAICHNCSTRFVVVVRGQGGEGVKTKLGRRSQPLPFLNMFKKKSKKPSPTSLPPPPANSNLEDDLFAQLDAQDALKELPSHDTNKSTKSTTTTTTTTSTESSTSGKLSKLKKDSKLRFKAREVSVRLGVCVAIAQISPPNLTLGSQST